MSGINKGAEWPQCKSPLLWKRTKFITADKHAEFGNGVLSPVPSAAEVDKHYRPSRVRVGQQAPVAPQSSRLVAQSAVSKPHTGLNRACWLISRANSPSNALVNSEGAETRSGILQVAVEEWVSRSVTRTRAPASCECFPASQQSTQSAQEAACWKSVAALVCTLVRTLECAPRQSLLYL